MLSCAVLALPGWLRFLAASTAPSVDVCLWPVSGLAVPSTLVCLVSQRGVFDHLADRPLVLLLPLLLAGMMRFSFLVLFSIAPEARAEAFLSRGVVADAAVGVDASAASPVLLQALEAGCGKPCERVLQSAFDAVANKTAGTVPLVYIALPVKRLRYVACCRRAGSLARRLQAVECECFVCWCAAVLLAFVLRPIICAGTIASEELSEGRKAATPLSHSVPGGIPDRVSVYWRRFSCVFLAGVLAGASLAAVSSHGAVAHESSQRGCLLACCDTASFLAGTPCGTASECQLLSAAANRSAR